MLANVFTKTLRDRRLGMLIGALGVVSVAVFGLAAYSDLDETIAELYGSMPDAFVAILGVGDIANAGTLIIGEIVNLMGPMVLGGLAISMGRAAVAGEERDRTLGVLLGNPTSRQSVVLSKAGAMVVLVAAGSAVSWAGSHLVAVAFQTDMTSLRFGEAMVHVAAISLFFGFLALFIGSWTGRGAMASGVSVGLLIFSFLAAGLLPLVEGLENLAKAFPWYYFNSSQPLANGIDWGHLSILVGAVMVLGLGSVVGVNRRDLRAGEGYDGLLERLRAHPLTEKMARRLQGRANVSSVAVKTVSENQMLVAIAGMIIVFTALVVGPMFNGLSGVLKELSEAIPEALVALIGGADMATPEGWYQTEVFSITAPAALIVVTAMMGARALAGEEEDNTMDLLLTNPITRPRVVLEKAVALVVIAFALGAATFVGTMAGSLIGGLGMSWGNVAAASLLATLLGIFFGFVALATAAGTGSRRAAVMTASGAAFVGYFANAFLPVSASLSGWARLSPFHYYLGGDPLIDGLDLGNVAVLTSLCLVALALAVPLFQNRDVRA